MSAFLWHISQDKAPTLLSYQKSLKTTVENEYNCEEGCLYEVTIGHAGTLRDLSSCPSCDQFYLPLQGVDTEEFYHFFQSIYISSILGLIFKFTEVIEASKHKFFEFILPVVLHPYRNLCSLTDFVLPLSLIQWFSNFIVQQSHLKGFLNTECWALSPDFLFQ